ncbi:Glyoxylase, beta-lactamase superfamily II [[Clostridium] aminophilum]|uniref:Glyoxylase, beta-lactamase superfamily II n=1 Tax=[Clostridium] aminophilum TaxID=1526 RepID=A0A1I0FL20_9FIRM|nr:MBL fold metallo-hydrolase [[Clostridium] aminophilum]SET58263.1 Glyoxylase, beta-lactamase superfamily II [[Clostridium] aminophilum]
MKVERYDSGLLDSSMYVVSDNGHAIVIDPCLDTVAAEKFAIDYLFITHEHYDHIFGVNKWKERTDAPLVCSKICGDRIENSKKNQARHFDSFCEIQSFSTRWNPEFFDLDYTCEADITFEKEKSFDWQGHIIRLIEIPGHSPGSIGIWIDDMFFSGDSLLEGKEIELRFPGGSSRQWEENGKKVIDSIPDGTLIYPGHFDCFVLKR